MAQLTSAGLGGAASRGALVTMGGQFARIAIQFGGLLVLARLLDPTDYGILAMVTAIVGIGEVFRDFGLSSAAIQARDLSNGQRSNLFWINSGIGLFLALVFFLLAPLIAALYDQPELVALTQFLALTFLISGFSTQYRANLNREMRFFMLSMVDILGQTAGLVAAIILAMAGSGYWALGWQQMIQGLATMVLLVAVTRWLPRMYSKKAPVKPFINFGLNLLGAQLLGYASRNTDSVILGATVGPTQLGLYNRAFQLLVLPLNQIQAPATRVALPVLSKLQDDKERYEAFVLRGQTILIHVIVAIFGFAASQAPALIHLVLGPKWEAATPIFQIFCIAGVAQAASYVSYWVFLSKGLTRSNFRYSLVTRPALIIGILLGSLGGVYGIAWAYSIGLAVLWPLGLFWISRVSDAPALALFLNGMRVISLYAMCSAASWATTFLTASLLPIAQVAIGFAAFVAVLSLAILALRSVRNDVLGILHSLRLSVARRRG